MPDVLGYLRFILTYRINVIAPTPELPATILELQVAKLFINHQATLTLQIPNEAGYTHLGWYLEQHMDMVGTTLSLNYLHTFPLAELSQYFSYGSFLLAIENLSAIFWCKDYMIFTVPFRVR